MKSKIILLAIIFSVLVLTPTLIVAVDNGSDVPSTAPGVLADYAILQLKDSPVASYHGEILGYSAIPYGISKKIDLSSQQAIAYTNYLAGQHGNEKNWLASNAPWAQVIDEYTVTLNAIVVKLNGHDTKSLSSGPGVIGVYQDYLFTLQMNRSTTLINAPVLWSAVGGQSNAGAGIKIGIIDSGIDNTHPFLTDASLSVPAGFPLCDARDASICSSITSNKVIVAKVYNEPDTDFDAHAAQDHGTHVSGIAAGVSGTPCGSGFPVGCVLSGVAPKAWLGNYNVFPGTVLDASSHAIARAVEDAVTDGMDVLNLSLGGTPRPGDILVNAVNSAVDSGVVVAIAAGNAGPGLGTVESPGIAENVITVGASSNPHFLGISVTVGSSTFGAVVGQFANYVPPITASYALTSPTNGCTAISTPLAGKIALIRRGTCTFSTKIRNAQTAGAIGALIINSQVGDPIAMAKDGTPGQPTIPAAMVSNVNGAAMGSSGTVTVDGTSFKEFFSDGPSADILASFSSWGPVAIGTPAAGTPGIGVGTDILKNYIKPDVVAPGLNVYSSIRMASCASPPCYAFFSGTSMATPHVAGSAALLKQLHPDWTPQQIKSALSNTAVRPVRLFTNGSTINDPVIRGVGRIDLGNTATFSALISTNGGQIGIDFGTLPSSSIIRMDQITLTSISSSTVIYTITVTPGLGVTTDSSILELIGGESQTFGVTLQLSPSQPVGEYFGDITISGGSVILHVPFWYLVDNPSGGHGHNPI